MSIVRELVQRADSWVNAMTGLGTLRDKLMHAQVVAGSKLQDPQLEALFNDDDVARRVVAKLPREATRRGFYLELEGDPDEEQPADIDREMQVAFSKLDAMPKLRDGWIWARLYGGGSGLFVGADDGLPVDQPLNEAAIRSIKFLNIVKRPQLSIHRRYEDVREPKYGEPELYTISQATGILAPQMGLTVHETRLILFDGALTARLTMESPTGFDDSVLQSTYTPLQQTATAWQSIAHLMTDASQGVLKIANLVDLVAAGGQETLRSRIQLMDLARSVCRSILVDAEKESFERVSTSFAGLPEVMDKLMMRMSAAAEQPVTLLYGRSPAGMNATGESDIRGWYDTVAEAQTDELKPRLERLLTLMFLAKDSPTAGVLPEQWCIEFNPLWQPTEKEVADTRKVVADTFVALVGGNVMTDAEAGLGLAPDFPTIDVESRTRLAEADKEEGTRPREVNAPEPEPELLPGKDDDPGGGGAAKPRGDGGEPRGDSNQPREPAGSPRGGQWASSGGGGGGGASRGAAAGGGMLTEEQRAGIRRAGTAAVMTSLQQKLVQRYGVPAKQAALMYEREIKQQMKAAKAQRAGARAVQQAAAKDVAERLEKSRAAMQKAIAAKKAAEPAAEPKKASGAADEKREARNKKAREKRSAEKAKKLAEANKKRAEEVKQGEETRRATEADQPPSKTTEGKANLDGMRASFASSQEPLYQGHAATMRMVQDYLGGAERTAPAMRLDHTDLTSKGWGGFNDLGMITIHSKHAKALLDPPKARSLPDAQKAYRDAILEHNTAKDALKRPQWDDERLTTQRKKVAEAEEELTKAQRYESAQLVMVHEELHSFGPLHTKDSSVGRLYRGKGVVAEEVATEVLARDAVLRSRAPTHDGAYQKQIKGVLSAMHRATKKDRTREEQFGLLVQASRTYKKKTASGDLMSSLHASLRHHAPDLDETILREQLNAVPEP